MKDNHKAVQKTFSASAEKYVNSALHAKGKDLQALAGTIDLTGNETVLDIATGGGHVSNALAPLAKEVIAMDVTVEMLQSAEAFIRGNGHENVRFAEGDAESLPYVDEAFDGAACRIAAHHFSRPDVFLRETFRVLKSGGSFFLLDNTAPEADVFDTFYNKVEKLRDPSHVRAWKKSEWIAKIEKAGFTVEHMQRFRKTFDFQDWCERLDVDADTRRMLQQLLAEAPPSIQQKFNIRYEDDGHVRTFDGESILLEACK
ncbi:methyltransferase domain-containing protein [Salicibibacter cibarius]|uniref:Methyltransferase domain-containing protein n=1 Tax=Salicibibacter cibarius TaxID=2743000 RepID=A0A7T6Z7Q9_9BACI|nr:methyltransferase domain-containing protein [Salicibibacter cibarius]QQK77921.1 methyltransferase domain-containing protein [Salicibibacter cibarius]